MRANARWEKASYIATELRLRGSVGVLAVVFVSLPVHAQSDQSGPIASDFRIVPRITVAETLTNNVFLSSGGKKSELITQVSPAISISRTGGRIKGSLDYALTEQIYANNSSRRRSLNTLNASGTLEAIDNWMFVDFGGTIGQQSISAFGAPTVDASLLNGNSTETAVYRLSPYVRGRLGSQTEYEARYSLSSSRSDASTVADVNSRDLSVRLNGSAARRGVGWDLFANHQTIDYSAGRSASSQRINGQLSYPLSTQWGTYVKFGRESSNFASANTQSLNFTALGVSFTPNDEAQFNVDVDNNGKTGLTVRWAPSKRTSVSVVKERRLFGDSQTIALAYRTTNTAWTYSDTRSALTSTGLSTASTPDSLYDLLLAQFSASEPDPIRREQFGAYLQANGIRPAATAIGGFLTSALSLQNQRQLGVALFGARNTLSITATRGSNTRLDTTSAAVDDLSSSSVVRQGGLVVNLSHRFTPASTLNVVAARQTASGAVGQPGTSTKTVNVNLSTRLTKDATASIGARRVVFDSVTAPFSETAVLGNVSVQF